MRKESIQLKIDYGTAQNRLRKKILFKYIKLANHNICVRCNTEIEDESSLSIEHIKPWLDEPNGEELFWDLDNIRFSHLKCNIRAVRRRTGLKHPSQESYKRGCRCEECKEIQKLRIRKYRKNLLRGVQVDPGFH